MRLVTLVLLALSGCAGGPTPPAEPSGPDPEPVTLRTPIREETLLGRDVPTPGPNTRATAALTAQLAVGRVRCPLAGSGKLRVRHGTPRDGLPYWGVLLSLDIDPATDASWNPAFDQVRSEDEWVALPAMPGQTRSWVDAASRTLEMDHPAAVAGQTVTCTAVREVTTRTLKGRVEGTVPPNAHFVPCFKDSPAVAGDGTFVVDVPVPCTGWIEGGGLRSDKLRIDAGEGVLEHTFVLSPDTLQRADRSWTPEGAEAASQAIARMMRSRDGAAEVLERVEQDLKTDAEATETLSVWRTGLWEQKLLLEGATRSLKEDLERAEPKPPAPGP